MARRLNVEKSLFEAVLVNVAGLSGLFEAVWHAFERGEEPLRGSVGQRAGLSGLFEAVWHAFERGEEPLRGSVGQRAGCRASLRQCGTRLNVEKSLFEAVLVNVAGLSGLFEAVWHAFEREEEPLRGSVGQRGRVVGPL